MSTRKKVWKNRTGVAAVEMAVTLPFLLCVIVGILVIGRMAQVLSILTDAVDVAARQAAQGQYSEYDAATQTYSTIQVTTANLTTTVQNYLTAAGVNNAGVTVGFTAASGAVNPATAVYDDLLTISATLPYSSFGWTSFGLFNPEAISFSNPPTSIKCVMQIYSMNAQPLVIPTSPPGWNGYPNTNP